MCYLMQRCLNGCWDVPISSNGFCVDVDREKVNYEVVSWIHRIRGADHGVFDIQVNARLLWVNTDFDRIVHTSNKQNPRIMSMMPL